MRHLVYSGGVWKLVKTDVSDKFGKRYLVEIKPDELIIIFTRTGGMQSFTYEKEMERLYLKSNDENYEFGGRVFGKEDSDIFVYKKHK